MLTFGISPGHGGKDKGAMAKDGSLNESEYVIYMARMFKTIVDNLRDPYRVVLLRDLDDEDPTFEERAKRAKAARCDLVLCFHVNSFESELLRGSNSFYLEEDLISRDVGSAWLRSVPEPLYTLHRKATLAKPIESDPSTHWLKRPETVLKKYHCPACLIEFGFLSNPKDKQAPVSYTHLTLPTN